MRPSIISNKLNIIIKCNSLSSKLAIITAFKPHIQRRLTQLLTTTPLIRSIMSSSALSTSTASSIPSSTTSTTSTKLGHPVITPHLSSERGHANLGWLNSYHTFSFGSYFNPDMQRFHSLRVINEDRVAPSEGFPSHPHREFEIFSYVVSGAIRHTDSLGHKESLPRGSVQFTSAGTGLSHSEYNDSDKDLVHFMQLWVKPNKTGLKPSYATKHWSDADKTDQLRLLLSEDGREDTIQIHQDMNFYASILNPNKTIEFTLQPGRDVYVHLIQDAKSFDKEANTTALTIQSATSTIKLSGGDGAFIKHSTTTPNGAEVFTLTGSGADGAPAEFILFDIKKE